MAATKKQWFIYLLIYYFFFRFLFWTESSPTVIQSPEFTND